MTITDIKPQVKRQGRYSIYVDGKYAFSLSENALLEQTGVRLRREVTGDELRAFQKAAQLDKAYNLALAYVARRARSAWELRDYLRRKDLDDDATEHIMRRLQGYGYVDDRQFAQSWVDNRRALKPVSRRRLVQELRQKHVPDEIAQQVLAEDATSDVDTLADLIGRKRKQSRYHDETKLMQYLARQGYNYDDIKQALTTADN